MPQTSPGAPGASPSWLFAATFLAACAGTPPSPPQIPSIRAVDPTPAHPPDELTVGFEMGADCEAPPRSATLPADPASCPVECPAGTRDEQGCCPDPGAAGATEQACRACDPWACLQRASAHAHAMGIPRDETQARTYRTRALLLFDQACAQGGARACLDASRLHTQDEDFDKVRKQEQRACKLGSQDACTVVARRLALYDQTDDLQRALALLTTACASGLGAACTLEAEFYSRAKHKDRPALDRVVPADDARAAKLFRTACEIGDGDGCIRLAWSHRDSLGVARSPSLELTARRRAIQRWESQCRYGDGNGCFYASWYYDWGDGVPRWPEHAGELRVKACNAGNTFACEALQRAATPPPPAPALPPYASIVSP